MQIKEIKTAILPTVCVVSVAALVTAVALETLPTPPNDDSLASRFHTWRIGADFRTVKEAFLWLLEP